MNIEALESLILQREVIIDDHEMQIAHLLKEIESIRKEIENSTAKLKNCPFCNSDDLRMKKADDFSPEVERIVCNYCHASGPNAVIASMKNKNAGNGIVLWNMRKGE